MEDSAAILSCFKWPYFRKLVPVGPYPRRELIRIIVAYFYHPNAFTITKSSLL